MSSADKNLSAYSFQKSEKVGGFQFGIVVSEWNHEVTEAMFEGSSLYFAFNGCQE